MAKDYYEILGVPRTATQDEIKKAFRKLAHQYHPDKGGGDETKFKEINGAYQVLSDEQKRSRYDQFSNAETGGFGGGGGRWEDFASSGGPFQGFHTQVNFDDIGDIFGDFFGMGRGAKTSHGRTRAARGRDLEIDATLSFHEAVHGTKKKITIEAYRRCSRCNGKGAEDASALKKCGTCAGVGEVEQAQRTFFGTFATRAVCPSCRGEGTVIKNPCPGCRGEGRVLEEQELEITVPAGIGDGTTLRLREKGETGIRGSGTGDLFINVHVAADDRFQREGDNIISVITLSVADAALGAVLPVDTVDGLTQVTIPAGTQPDDRIRLKEKGIPRLHGNGRGDHFLIVKVAIPKKLSKKKKSLFESLREEE